MVREAYKLAVPPLALGMLALLWHWYTAGGMFLFLGSFILYFFRDPERKIPDDPAAVVSPADGRIVAVAAESLGGRPGQRISIFLAVWNVHVNRAPVGGRIEAVEYRRGRFFAAMRARASEENEQNVIRLSSEHGEIVFKQIAGWIARRVICWKRQGDVVERGERVGLIRFGSRVDVWLPAEADIVVRPGQNVAGGSSILARWK